ncbi:60S ribosomal protein [Musa troglodytarum]|uniref:60S ribosomal protein n=1 Tax=Musa troglodytarum TaxID=320322 RepID=A0A9E7JGR4_9LILI|nr:60S ribosomal protein [Musa troglodytarum]
MESCRLFHFYGSSSAFRNLAALYIAYGSAIVLLIIRLSTTGVVISLLVLYLEQYEIVPGYGGVDIPHSDQRFAGFKKDEMQLDAEAYFSEYIRRQVEPDGMEDMYEKVHAAIRTDPTAGKERKRFNLKKLTYEERKARLIEQLNALNACAGADDFDEDEDDE